MTPPDHDGGLVPRLLTLMGIGGVASGVADTLLSRGPYTCTFDGIAVRSLLGPAP